jgi:hypothetical protein
MSPACGMEEETTVTYITWGPMHMVRVGYSRDEFSRMQTAYAVASVTFCRIAKLTATRMPDSRCDEVCHVGSRCKAQRCNSFKSAIRSHVGPAVIGVNSSWRFGQFKDRAYQACESRHPQLGNTPAGPAQAPEAWIGV